MAFAKRDMQSSASIAVNYLEPSSPLGLNGLAISRVNPYGVAKPSAASWERHKCIQCMRLAAPRSDLPQTRWAKSEADWRGVTWHPHREFFYSLSKIPSPSDPQAP